MHNNDDLEYFRNRCNVLEEENRNLRGRVMQLEQELALLKETVTALVARNIDAKPDRQNNVKKRNHKPGRKKGHEGKTRKKPDHIDARVVVDIKECSRCGSTLSKPTESYTRVVEDIIPARVIVTQYVIVRRYCRNCKRQVSCNVPDALPGEHFGLRLMAFIVSLKLLGLSYEKISDLFRTFFSLEITEAAINHAVVKVSEAFGSRYHEMLQELKTERNIHGDETSWRINGKNHWLWAFVSKWTVLYEIDKSRGSCVPERVLGDYDGCVTSDSWPAWNGVGGTHQRCHWHYINEIKDTFKYKNPGRQFRKFAKKLRRILYDSQRAGTVRSLKKRARAKKRFEERIGKLASCKYAEKNCVRLAKRLRREKGMLFTFLVRKGVEYHNNAAERAIRPCVVIRKITSGNKTVQGALAQAVLLSVKETCKKRSTNFYEYALDYLRSTSKS